MTAPALSGLERGVAQTGPYRATSKEHNGMSQTVGDYLLDRLATWGVTRIYGYPGDGINGLMGAFERSSNGLRPPPAPHPPTPVCGARGAARCPELIQMRHPEMTAFTACAHPNVTSESLMCMANTGPRAVP